MDYQLEEQLSRTTTSVKVDLQWKNTFGERWHLMQHDLWWRMTFEKMQPLIIFNGWQPLMEEDILWSHRIMLLQNVRTWNAIFLSYPSSITYVFHLRSNYNCSLILKTMFAFLFSLLFLKSADIIIYIDITVYSFIKLMRINVKNKNYETTTSFCK